MLGEYYRYSKDEQFVNEMYDNFIKPAANFLAHFIDPETGLPHASYDLWEERFMTSTYTTCTVIAGLDAAAKLANAINQSDEAKLWQSVAYSIRSNLDGLMHPDGYFRRGYLFNRDGETVNDDITDISTLYGLFMYSGISLSDQRLAKTAEKVENTIANVVPIGGVVRYEHDNYFLTKGQYLGNPWVVCSLWLAQYLIASNNKDEALRYIDWSLKRRLHSGILSEQFDPDDGAPLGVAPLVWSHAEVLNTLLDYYDIDN